MFTGKSSTNRLPGAWAVFFLDNMFTVLINLSWRKKNDKIRVFTSGLVELVLSDEQQPMYGQRDQAGLTVSAESREQFH